MLVAARSAIRALLLVSDETEFSVYEGAVSQVAGKFKDDVIPKSPGLPGARNLLYFQLCDKSRSLATLGMTSSHFSLAASEGVPLHQATAVLATALACGTEC